MYMSLTADLKNKKKKKLIYRKSRPLDVASSCQIVVGADVGPTINTIQGNGSSTILQKASQLL